MADIPFLTMVDILFFTATIPTSYLRPNKSICFFKSNSTKKIPISGNFFFFSTKAQNRYTDVSYPDQCYLLFGKESAGLPEKLLFDHPDQCVRIPMMDGFRSLNLSNSVAIGAFEVLRQWDFPTLSCSGELRAFDWAAAKSAHPNSEFL